MKLRLALLKIPALALSKTRLPGQGVWDTQDGQAALQLMG
jgi:hypothetical protein